MRSLILAFLLSSTALGQQVLQICSPQNPCPGFPLGSVQAGIDQNGWRHFKLTLTQNITLFSFIGTPPPAQANVTVIFTQDAIGGRTVVFASNISSPCAITATANATTLCQFEYDGTTATWFGISSGAGGNVPAGVVSGSELVSNGSLQPPVYQVKPRFDLRDFGAVPDDATDNCTVGSGGNAVAAFVAAVNAFSGPGVPTAFIGMGKGDKGYLIQTCNMAFTIPVRVEISGTVDFGTNTSANGIQIGSSSAAAWPATNQPYTITGGGTIVGGGSLTNAVIEIEPFISEFHMLNMKFHNAGGASNWVILEDVTGSNQGIPGWEMTDVISWNDDTTAGRKFMKFVATVGGTGHIHGVHIVGANGAVGTGGNACGGTGAWLGAPLSRFDDLEVFAYGAPVILSPLGTTDTVFTNGVFDDNNCTRLSVQAPIQLGDPSSTANVGPVSFLHSSFTMHAGDAGVFAKAGDATAANISAASIFAFNRMGGSGSPLGWTTSNCGGTPSNPLSSCPVFDNPGLTTIANSLPSMTTGDNAHFINSYWDGSEYIFSPGTGTTLQLGGGVSFADPLMVLVPNSSTGSVNIRAGTQSGTVIKLQTDSGGTVVDRFVINRTGGMAFSKGNGTAVYSFDGHLNQSATGNWAGTCTMTTTTCTITLTAAFTGTPGCVATVQGGTAIAGACSVSGTTVTITAATSNTATWAAMLFGNPN